MLKPFRQLISLFTPKERLRLLVVFIAMAIMGFLQMLGVGVVLPFASLLANPDYIFSNDILSWIYTTLGFNSTNSFLLFTGAILLVVLVGSNVFTSFTIWALTNFAWGVQERISIRLLDGYLHQPYKTFLNRNSADIGKNILYESQQFAYSVLIPVLKTFAFGITALMLIGFLFWIQPLVAFLVIVIFGGAYFLIYFTIRRFLLYVGRRRMEANTARFQAVNEAFGSIKEVKVLGREGHFLNRYKPNARGYAKAMAHQQVLGEMPRYIIEGLAFGIIMAVMLYLLARGKNLLTALPLASAFVLAGYRLLPALQNIYVGVTKWRFNQSVLDTLEKDLSAYKPSFAKYDNSAIPRLDFEKSLNITSLNFSYPNSNSKSLNDISLSISKNSFIALTGATGSGKTTLVDIMLGLLEPDSGKIAIDNVTLSKENLSNWQANIGYVPQDIYLTDSSIAGNIAYGLSSEDIDKEALYRAAKIASIHDFITNKLPDGYDTVVGERGVRLSGGQRQRIGIARALYHDPSVIVLDEATSALDNKTERKIVNELDAMRGGRTLIVIAHRLTTVQKCHKIFLLNEGKIIAQGNYEELVNSSAEFSQLSKVGAGQN